MKFRIFLYFTLASALSAVAALLSVTVVYALGGMFIDSLRYGRIIGGGMEDGFPILLALVAFLLVKWAVELWRAWHRLLHKPREGRGSA